MLVVPKSFPRLDLVWVADVNTAVTGVPHSIIVSVLLVKVGDTLAVVQEILDACMETQ